MGRFVGGERTGSNEGDEAGDRHRALVLLVHGRQAEPEEERRSHHRGKGKREAVVDKVNCSCGKRSTGNGEIRLRGSLDDHGEG